MSWATKSNRAVPQAWLASRHKARRTARTRAGEPVANVSDLDMLMRLRRSVFWEGKGTIPAAVVMNFPVCVVLNAMRRGWIRHYPTPRKERASND